jgi:hypothetical protein
MRNRRFNEANSYGWIVEDYDAKEAYDFACEYFGEDELNSQIVQAISTDELAACLAFIFRMNDFREWEEYKNGGSDEFDESFRRNMRTRKESVRRSARRR